MTLRFAASTLALAIAGILAASAAQAQSSSDNAVESAEDAFGTSTGHDNIGVYDENNVRGFSPGSAGNFRMEGMYFDIQGGLGNRVVDGEVIRVGIAAQGYAFPAPTGVVDISLKKAGDKTVVSPFFSVDSFGSRGLEVDAQLPLAGKTLGIAGGAGVYDNTYSNGGGSRGINVGGVLRWRPTPAVEVLTFANHQQFWDDTSQAIYIPNGNDLPPRPQRGIDTSPPWARNEHHADTFGMVGRANMGDWTLRAGLFRSAYSQDSGYTNLVFTNPDRSTERKIYASPASRSASWSGEARLSRRFAEGPRQHLIMLSLRGRSIDAHYGGGEVVPLGTADIDEVIDVPKPVFNFTALTDDFTRQTTAGLSYSLKWKDIGEFTAGLQRTHYVKELGGRRSTNATLPYLSAALTMVPKLVLYGSYVRGLEDSGSAPGYASNANEILPASRTSQYDFGLRWTPIKDTTLIVGYFRIAKPLIDIDNANHYGVLGAEVHKGIEFSITSNPTKSVRIVAGGVWLDPRIEASNIAQPVGKRPVGQPQLRTRFNINWTPPFAKALTLDAYVNHDSGAYGTIDDSIYAPGSTRVGVGGRYRFKLGGKEFTARVGLYNIFDVYMQVPFGNGVYGYNTQRNVQAWITTDL